MPFFINSTNFLVKIYLYNKKIIISIITCNLKLLFIVLSFNHNSSFRTLTPSFLIWGFYLYIFDLKNYG